MVILYILSGTGVTDGSTKSFLNMLKGSIDAGHRCHVVCPNADGIYLHLKQHNIPVYVLKYRFNATFITHGMIPNIINWLKWQRRKYINIYKAFKLIKICRNIQPDIIHTNSSIINIGYIAAKKLKIPHITHFREYGDIDFNYIIHGISKQIYDHKAFFISITRDIAQYKSLPSSKTKVIYNGICSTSDIRFNEIKEPYILYAGRIQKTKGIYDLISAYLQYCDKTPNPLKLKIAGSYNSTEGADLKDAISKRLEAKNISQYVEWLGECSNINDLMFNAYITIIPSEYEGFGRVMPEAIANGCLVIGRNTGGTKEQFDNGSSLGHEIGIRFSNNDELAEAIYNVHNKGIRGYYSIISHAQSIITDLYTIESYQKSILDFYHTILKNNHSKI